MKKMLDHGPRRLILLLLIVSMLAAACPSMAESVPAQPAIPQGNPYRIVLVAPGGWTNNNGAAVKATITDKNGIGWQKIEYRMNNGLWIDCEAYFDKGKAEIAVHENGTFTLRVTDPYDRTFEESAEVNSIALAAPVVSSDSVKSSFFVMSPPIISGERIIGHRVIIVRCSASVKRVQFFRQNGPKSPSASSGS